MEKNDVKEKLIIVGILTGIFLPARLLFIHFVSDHWLGSLGLISAFAILLVILIQKQKLGRFSKIFENQLKKTVGSKMGKYIIGFAVFFLLYFGVTLFFIDRGNTIYFDDKEIFFAIVNEDGFNIEDTSTYDLIGPQLTQYAGSENFQNIAKLDYMFSISYAVMDDMSDGWLSHFVVIMFVEQIEVIGLLFFFRNKFKSINQVQTT